jgi:hypothetical protein
MSSHREAPEISKDPAADNTDVYAFVSPDDASTVTLVANFIPFQNPDGGPNFYAFGKDVLYEIHIHNTPVTTRGQKPDITYQFRFTETYKTPTTYMYNTGGIGVNPAGAGADGSNLYPNLNRTQTYTVTRVDEANPGGRLLTPTPLPVPPCNIGVFSTPNYTKYVHPAIKTLNSGETVFAGQRADPFFVDLGSVFDLADLRPLQFLHTGPLFPAPGVDSFRGFNVFTIALKVPKAKLTSNGQGVGNTAADIMAQRSVIGVYASASRQMNITLGADGKRTAAGTWQQVSRLANPLFNELLIGIADKDRWNASPPTNDEDFEARVTNPDLAQRLPGLYPLPFQNLAFYNAHSPNRQDLKAILLTGIPKDIIPGFQNFTGPQPADLMRLNMAIPVTARPNPLGVIGGDLQGFPNGRRPADDVADIELKAVAGATLPLTDKSTPRFVTDVAVNLVADYAGPDNGGYLPNFPYITTPSSGSATMPRAYAPQ